MTERESVRVLEECIELQKRKSQDYQNDKSNVKQAMHYRRGVSTIHDMISQKLLRAQSLLEAFENGDTSEPNFEGLEDTYKDLINYTSFAVSFIRGKMEGQDGNRDMLNRRREWTQEEIDDYIPFEAGRIARSVVFAYPPLMNDTSGGSASGQIEDDGFITTHGLNASIQDVGHRIDENFNNAAKYQRKTR